MKRTRTATIGTLALIATAVVLAACGGSSDPAKLDVSPPSLLDSGDEQPAPGGDQPIPVEPDEGIGTTSDETPIPVEPDGGIGETPLPVEPDGGIGTTPDE